VGCGGEGSQVRVHIRTGTCAQKRPRPELLRFEVAWSALYIQQSSHDQEMTNDFLKTNERSVDCVRSVE